MSSIILRRALFPRATVNLFIYSTISTTTTTTTTVETIVTLLTHHRSKSRWSTLLSLFPQGFSPHEISQILLKTRKKPHLSLNFFHFVKYHFCPSSLTLHCYATITHILARAHLKSRAKTLIKEAILVDFDEKKIKFFWVLVETFRVCDSSPIVFDLLIKTLLDVNKLDPCLEIVRFLRSRGFSLHVNVCNMLIGVAFRVKGCFFGYDLYREMFSFDDDAKDCKFKVFPNVHTLNEVMLAFYRDRSVDMVEEVWIEMSRLKFSPNVCSYSILMAVYCEEGEMVKARNVWEELKVKGLEVDIICYNTLIGGYCRIGEIGKGEELYKEMGLSGLEGTCVTYQHLVRGYCLVGDAESALLLYKVMDRKGFSLDSSSVDLVVGVVCGKKSALQALEFFRNVTGCADFVAKETSYEVLIKGLCSEGKMEEALKLQAQMVGKGFRPTSRVYDAFIDGYVKQGRVDVAEQLRKELITIH